VVWRFFVGQAGVEKKEERQNIVSVLRVAQGKKRGSWAAGSLYIFLEEQDSNEEGGERDETSFDSFRWRGG